MTPTTAAATGPSLGQACGKFVRRHPCRASVMSTFRSIFDWKLQRQLEVYSEFILDHLSWGLVLRPGLRKSVRCSSAEMEKPYFPGNACSCDARRNLHKNRPSGGELIAR